MKTATTAFLLGVVLGVLLTSTVKLLKPERHAPTPDISWQAFTNELRLKRERAGAPLPISTNTLPPIQRNRWTTNGDAFWETNGPAGPEILDLLRLQDNVNQLTTKAL